MGNVRACATVTDYSSPASDIAAFELQTEVQVVEGLFLIGDVPGCVLPSDVTFEHFVPLLKSIELKFCGTPSE